MDPIPEQVAYFLSRMPTKQDRRAWRHHYLHRAEMLEKDFKEYAGLKLALETALRTQQPEKPASGSK